MNLKGKISISRRTGGGVDDSVRIEIVDTNSGIHFCEAELTLENFALALTGLGNVECNYTVRGNELIGKHKEVKTVHLKIPKEVLKSYGKERIAFARKIAEKEGLFNNGWCGSIDEVDNMHRRRESHADGSATYDVSLHRYVDKKETQE